MEEVVSGQSRLRRISTRRGGLRLQLSVECLAATRRGARSDFGFRISDCGMGKQGEGHREEGRGERKCGFRISDCGMENGPRITDHESRTAQKLTGRTKPFLRKTNATKAMRHNRRARGNAEWRTLSVVSPAYGGSPPAAAGSDFSCQ